MYWIYFAIFILAILTPKFIQGGNAFVGEEETESFLILLFGSLGFMIYLAKDKMLLKLFREKLHLEKQTSMITRDLSDSYSYIGEMNRKFDIVQDLIFDLPKATAAAVGGEEKKLYSPLLETAALLGKTDRVMLCFVDTKEQILESVFEKQSTPSLAPHIDPKQLLAEGKFFWEEQDYAVVRSPRQVGSITAFLIFAKMTNHIEDGDLFKILVSQALLLYSLEHKRRGGDR